MQSVGEVWPWGTFPESLQKGMRSLETAASALMLTRPRRRLTISMTMPCWPQRRSLPRPDQPTRGPPAPWCATGDGDEATRVDPWFLTRSWPSPRSASPGRLAPIGGGVPSMGRRDWEGPNNSASPMPS
ncbi:MAG: hypothetical protein Ct9H300mP12_10350 [Acidimicrobiales bacterium]|nr:MAG: hypothetical protein Ct9H300mP12_10350 [Acidimicrobiales bacterium]